MSFRECERQDNEVKSNTMKKASYLEIVYWVLEWIHLFFHVLEMFM